jgi:antitoxin ParD1/3/4
MTTTLILGEHFETFITTQLATGRYADASEVVRDGLRLLERRERREREAVAAVEEGLADVEAGRLHDAEVVYDELEAELARMSATSAG